LSEQRQTVNRKQNAVLQMERERSTLLANIAGETRRAEGLREQLDRMNSRGSKMSEDESRLRTGIAEAEKAVSAAGARVAMLEKELAELDARLGQLGAGRSERAR